MSETLSLQSLFDDFSEKVNATPRIRSLMKDWQPEFVIEARDTGEKFDLGVSNGLITHVAPRALEASDQALLLRADSRMLHEIFQGRHSPLAAYSDGLLEVYGDQRDQTKLDAIALILWGI